MRQLLDAGDFTGLFSGRLGWDEPPPGLTQLLVEDTGLVARALAAKRGVLLWTVRCEQVPSRADQHRVVRAVTRHSRGVLVVFACSDQQIWLWPEQRSSGVGYRLVDHSYHPDAGNNALLQRVGDVYFSLSEEPSLTTPIVLGRVRRSFNVEKVTNSFYKEFKKQHSKLVEQIRGITDAGDRRWYASVLLNRIMFVYFIQKKKFMDGHTDYLQDRLNRLRNEQEASSNSSYFRDFLLPLFHNNLGSSTGNSREVKTNKLIGNVPYVNGSIFEPHLLELKYKISIPDETFERLFDFLGQWRWHLDERPSGDPKEINPDVLGFIFEQYVNQKQQGAYYTKPDVTGYMTEVTLIPAFVDRLVAAGLEDPCLLLPNSGNRYLQEALGYGNEIDCPDQVAAAEAPDGRLNVALPGERWCDVLHRRKRYQAQLDKLNSNEVWDIDRAIVENLDLRTLIQDYLLALGSVTEVQAALDVLRSLTVCDPTVGSGAFLFAALDVLDDMYTAVLERAEELEAKGHGTAQFLEEARSRTGTRYWLLKTICLHNLYGVDLMAEAGEIAKLRLYLKLVSQLYDTSQIEPLPDLDFNIKAGNLLVGIADSDDAERRFMGGGGVGEVALPFDHLQQITNKCKLLAAHYEVFVSSQTALPGLETPIESKQELIEEFEAVRKDLDRELFRLRGEGGELAGWCESHRPFHWCVEFPSVWSHGGFDLIIGNPPYIGVPRNKLDRLKKFEYTWQGYETSECPDIYAACMERAVDLLNDQGRFAMIVMHSLCFNRKFEPLRNLLSKQLPLVCQSSYSLIPDSLFSGSAKVRNTIVVASKQSSTKFVTSRCRRWSTGGRETLFSTLEYVEPDPILLTCGNIRRWPFIDYQDVTEALAKLLREQLPILEVIQKGAALRVGYKKVARYMLGVFIDPPPVIHGNRTITTSEHDAWLSFANAQHRDLTFITLAGRWMYLWWLVHGDEYNVTKNTVESFPAGIEKLAHLLNHQTNKSNTAHQLLTLANKLKEELPRHLKYKKNAGQEIGRYDLRECAHITDEADWLLAQAWGLTREQYDAAGNLRQRMTFGHRE